MRRKREEVCGKPTQYNLQTQEYDWKELPDSHFVVQAQGPRVRDNNIFGPPSNANRAPPTPVPLPAPSRPIQEDFVPAYEAQHTPAEMAFDVMDGYGNGANPGLLARPHDLVPANVPLMPGAALYGANPVVPYAAGPPMVMQGQPAPLYVAPWSHDDIKRMAQMNTIEAMHCHLQRY